MGGNLDVVKTIWDVVKDGVSINGPNVDVNVIPAGSSVSDFQWNAQPVSYPETYSIYDIFDKLVGSDNPDVTGTISIIPSWFYDGNYIRNFTVSAEPHVSGVVLGNVNIKVRTVDTNSSTPAELYYEITVIGSGPLGSDTVVYTAVARGDGGGMSLSRS